MNKEEYKNAYGREVTAALNEMKGVSENADIGVVSQIFRDCLVGTAGEVVGYKVMKGTGPNGDAWWSEEVNEAVEEKKKGKDRLNERNVPAKIMINSREMLL